MTEAELSLTLSICFAQERPVLDFDINLFNQVQSQLRLQKELGYYVSFRNQLLHEKNN